MFGDVRGACRRDAVVVDAGEWKVAPEVQGRRLRKVFLGAGDDSCACVVCGDTRGAELRSSCLLCIAICGAGRACKQYGSSVFAWGAAEGSRDGPVGRGGILA